MKTTLYVMNEAELAERAATKKIHAAARAACRAAHGRAGHRYAILAWGFVRGLPYRRFERSHHITTNQDGARFEHNIPDEGLLARALLSACPDLAPREGAPWYVAFDSTSPTFLRMRTWLRDPAGAIPAPAPRVKVPFERQRPVAAE